MTKRVQQIIEDIRMKYKNMYERMLAEKKKSDALEQELKAYEAKFEQLSAKNSELEQIVNDVKIELEAALIQGKESSHSSVNRDEEIDELVREIEHCISQLKQ